MDFPISNETIMLYGATSDPRVKDTAKKLEEQGRIVLVHPAPDVDRGTLCYCSAIGLWPHGHNFLPLC